MKKNRKLAFIMALITMVSSCFMVPMTGHAETENEAVIVETQQEYATLSAAIAAATSGQTVKLLKDVTVSSKITKKDCGITIDGDGHTVTGTLTTRYQAIFEIQKYVTTFQNMTINVDSQHAQTWGAFISRYGEGSGNNGKLIIDNCTINVKGYTGSGAISSNNYGVYEIKNTNIFATVPVFYDHDDNVTITASNSTATAVSMGEATPEGIAYTESIDPFGTAEAYIGNKAYETLEAALKAVEDGQTITLLKDVNIEAGDGFVINANNCPNSANTTFTIDGNGHMVTSTISQNNRATFYLQKAGAVTFKNLTIETTNSADLAYGAIIARTGTVNLQNCNIQVTGTAGLSALGTGAGGGTINLNGGNTIKTTFDAFYKYDSNGVVTATGENNAIAPALGMDSIENLIFTKNVDPFGTTVAVIGDTPYTTLPLAFAAAEDGDTITLLKNITNETTTGSAGRINCKGAGINLTLDGNGKTISSVADVTLVIQHDSSLDSDNGGTLKLTIKDLIIENKATSGNGCTLQANSSTVVTLDGCELYSRENNNVGSIVVQSSGEVILLGGTVVAPTTGSAIVLNQAAAVATVYDADIEADYAVRTRNKNTTFNVCNGANIVNNITMLYETTGTEGMILNVTGGSIKTNKTDTAVIVAPNTNYTVNVYGGNFEGGNAIYANKADASKTITYSTNEYKESLMPLMADGASVRLATSGSGLRFESTIPKNLVDHINTIKDDGTTVTYGMVIAPANHMDYTHGIFSMELLNDTDISGAKYQRIIADKGLIKNEDGSITIRGALINIKLDHYNRKFAAVGYASYTINGETKYIYADYTHENNAISIYDAACAALSDADSYNEAEQEVLYNYYNGILNHEPGEEETMPETIVNVAEHTTDIFRTIGRTYIRNNGLACDFTCTGIEFNAYCAGSVYMKLNSSSTTYFTIYVDGERWENRISAKSTTTGWIELVYGLEPGNHTIMIVKQSQPAMSTNELLEIKITGEFNEIPEQKELFIEFYGDSILNGSNVYLGGTSAKTSDGTYGFGWIASQLLEADCNIIGRGGLGLVNDASGGYSMMDLYNLNGAYGASGVTEYDFARKPNAVVIELGCNDKVQGDGVSADTFKNGVADFVEIMREKYGKDVPIVWIHGYRDDEKDYWASAKEALDALKTAGDTQIYYCEVSVCYISKENGGDGWHPDVTNATRMGNEVAAYLENLLNQ